MRSSRAARLRIAGEVTRRSLRSPGFAGDVRRASGLLLRLVTAAHAARRPAKSLAEHAVEVRDVGKARSKRKRGDLFPPIPLVSQQRERPLQSQFVEMFREGRAGGLD